MPAPRPMSVALLYPGDRPIRERSDPAESRFAALFAAFAAAGVAAQPAVYHDEFADEVASGDLPRWIRSASVRSGEAAGTAMIICWLLMPATGVKSAAVKPESAVIKGVRSNWVAVVNSSV